MEAEPTRAQPPHRPGPPPLPANYVSLAQLQEQRRLKLERQRRKEEGEEAAAGRLRTKRGEEVEGDREWSRMLKEEAVRRPGRGGTILVPTRRGRRWGPTHWRRKRDGGEGGAPVAHPEARSQSGDGNPLLGVDEGREHGGGEKREGRGEGRGRTTGEPCRRNRVGNGTASECTESGVGGARAVAMTSGECDPQDRSETGGATSGDQPCPIDVEEGTKGQPGRGGVVPQLGPGERRGSVDLALSCRGEEGTKVTRNGFQSGAGKVCWRAKLSDPLEPDGTVDVACKLKDLRITMAEAGEVTVRDGDGGGRWLRRPTVGRRGGYPSFRANEAVGPRRWSRPNGDRMMWVRKTESS